VDAGKCVKLTLSSAKIRAFVQAQVTAEQIPTPLPSEPFVAPDSQAPEPKPAPESVKSEPEPLPDLLAAAERTLAEGRDEQKDEYQRLLEAGPRAPECYRQRYLIVLGLYAWRMGLREGDPSKYEAVTRRAFRSAKSMGSIDAFAICPKAWTAGSKTVWELGK
jgi:hypothetical protein